MRATRALRAWAPWLLVALACQLALCSPPAPAAASPLPCANEAFRTGASAALPDCRVYEQVSPAEKGGGNAVPSNLGLPAQAAPDGGVLAYLGYAPFPGSVSSTPLFAAHLSARSEHGWTTSELTPPKTSAGPGGTYFVEYAFSEDLAASVVDSPLQELAPNATPGIYNLFLRDAAGAYSLINTLPPLEPPSATCPSFLEPNCYLFVDVNTFAGASSSFERVIFESTARYLPGGTAEPSLYESALESGQRVVRLVGYMPNGEVAGEGSAAGGGSIAEVGAYRRDGRLAHAISSDGSHVVFEAPANGAETYETPQKGMTEVYDRIEHTKTLELSAPAPGVKPSHPSAAPARYWDASSNGSRVFFTSSAALTTASNTGEGAGEDLYEYDLQAPPTSALRDLSVDPGEAAGARVLGVLGVSEDGEYVYFAAEGALAPGAVAGQPNVYLEQGHQAPVLVATLSASDARDWTATPSAEGAQLASYVAPDGHHLAFASFASLPTANFGSEYDNRDRAGGLADSEVYEYTAPGAEGGASGTLDCASCGLGEGLPTGDALLGGTGASTGANKGGSGTPFHQPRALSADGGRLFFTAPDGEGDRAVYEYERDGEGSCAETGGCQFALAIPPPGGEDMFLDASANGDDVFIATTARLAASDGDELVDVYDVRVGGGFATQPQVRCEAGCHPPANTTLEAPVIASGLTGPSGNVPPRAYVPHMAKRRRHHRHARAHRRHRRRRAMKKRHRRRGRHHRHRSRRRSSHRAKGSTGRNHRHRSRKGAGR